MEKSLKSAYRRGIKIWCWEQELWSKSLSLGWPFGFPTLDLDFGKLFNCSQPQFPHTWGCLLWRMAMRVQRESTQSLVMLFLNVGRGGLLRFSPRKILGQEEGQDPCSFIAEASGSKWFRPIHRAWKWWAAAPGSLPTRPCDFWETGQVSFELSILRKMPSSICAERVPWCRSAISIRSPWGLGVMVGVCWILTLLSQACKGAGAPQETLRCHTQWIPFCLVSVWSILYFLPVAVLSAALEGNRHEIHQTVLASAVKSFCRPALRAGGGSEQDGQRSPGGQGGHWCLGPALCLEDRVWGMVLLATAANYSHARLQGSRGAGSVSRQNKGGELLFTRYPQCVESAKCYRHVSSGEGNVTGNRTPTKKEIVANLNSPSSFLSLLFTPSRILILQEDPSPALPVLRKQTMREKRPCLLYFLQKADLSPRLATARGWRIRLVHLAAAPGAVSGSLMRALPKR